jgi:hypothetical protein
LVVTTSGTLRDRAEFYLYAGTGSIYEQATVSVPISCPDQWFFADPPPECPLAPHRTTIIAQSFERGLLLWLQASDQRRPFDEILALYGDEGPLPRWQIMVDNWDAGMLEEDPDIVPPDGYYEPERGFGSVWRERLGVRDRLGWAVAQEAEVEDGAFQCASGKYGACYVSGPEGKIYLLEPYGSAWSVWPEPAPAP